MGIFLSYINAYKLTELLREDARRYFYSSCITISSALVGILSESYTWSTIKLYYSVFYGLRSYLALNRICIFYDERSPKVLKARPNERIVKNFGGRKASTTHGIVIETFKREFSEHVLLSQEIGGINSLDWLKSLREKSNYGSSRFIEPRIPPQYEYLVKFGTNRFGKLIESYVNDKDYQYTFDPDHAAIAFPTRLLFELSSTLKSQENFTYSGDDLKFMRELFSKNRLFRKYGPINCLRDLI